MPRKNNNENIGPTLTQEMVGVAHAAKYNLYLVAKALVFSALYNPAKENLEDAVKQTEVVLKTFYNNDHIHLNKETPH